LARAGEARKLRILHVGLFGDRPGPLGIWRAFSLAPEIAACAIKLQDALSGCALGNLPISGALQCDDVALAPFY
jgi:hypothetical protein